MEYMRLKNPVAGNGVFGDYVSRLPAGATFQLEEEWMSRYFFGVIPV